MASSYLDLYQGAGGFYNRAPIGGGWTPAPARTYGWNGGQQGTYRAGETQRVVHDTLNNKYYGTQKQSDLIKGLEDSIKRTQQALTQQGKTTYSNGWMGSLNTGYYRYTAKDRAEQNALIKQQQSYLKHIQGGGYKQEANTFFDSYDAYTQDYNNIYQRTYNNSVQAERNKETTARNVEIEKQNAAQLEKNRLQIEANDRMAAQNAIQERKNEKTRSRNKKIKGEAQAQQLQNQQGQTQNNGSRAKALTPNLEIGTGLLATAYRGLTNSGLTL